MLFFCVSIFDFVWDQPSPGLDITSYRAELTSRILISFVFCLGIVYFILVIRTFRSWRDPSISELERENMEVGRWTTRSPSPGRDVHSPRPPANMEQRLDGQSETVESK